MNINIPSKLRVALYILTAIGTPLVAYLLAKGVISDLEVSLWSAEVVVVSGIAAFHVPVAPSTPVQPVAPAAAPAQPTDPTVPPQA